MPISAPPIPPDPRKPPQVNPAAAPTGGPPSAAKAAAPPPPQPTAAQAPAAPAPEEPPVEEHYQTFWQHPFIQYVMPFLTSLTLHLGIIILGFLTAKVVQAVIYENRPAQQIVVPESQMVQEEGPEGGIPHPGLGGDPTRDAAQDKFPDVPKDSKGLAEKPGPNLQVSLMGGGDAGGQEGPAIIGVGGGIGRGGGTGAGAGSGIGSGDGDGSGALAPFGAPGGGGGIGPKSNFIGFGGRARKVAYVCDASGSMLNMFDALRVEIRKSTDALKPVQSFNVVFFQDEGYKSIPTGAGGKGSTALLMGTPESKRASNAFIDSMNVRGETNPIPALEAVSAMQPELVFLLTDGDFSGPGNKAVVDFIKKKFVDTKTNTKFYTIAFIDKTSKDNPQDLEYVKTLQEIAKMTGGKFKHVTDDDMGK